MSRALKALIASASCCEPRDYVARTKATNQACIRLLESLGFSKTSSYTRVEALGPTTEESLLFLYLKPSVFLRNKTWSGITIILGRTLFDD